MNKMFSLIIFLNSKDESVSFDKKSKTEETSGNERATLSNFNRNKNRRLAKNSNKKSLFQRKSQYLRAQSRKPTLLQRVSYIIIY